jgi:predicted ATPase
MRITDLEIRNFKAIKTLSLRELGDTVIIAGPNGCGKSCIFDAIRLLKSAYGGYGNQEEWKHFFSEFHINFNDAFELGRLFHDREAPVIVEATFTFSDYEKQHIAATCFDQIFRSLWADAVRGQESVPAGPAFAPSAAGLGQEIEEKARTISQPIIDEIIATSATARLTIDIRPNIIIERRPALHYAFSSYDPENIGIIDYHGPNRSYQRERLGGINVSIEESNQRTAQHALYNYQSKYSNIKSELAAAYVRDLIMEKAGTRDDTRQSVIATLQEMFRKFLPGKDFLGPQPGQKGELNFPVLLEGGGKYDIDDLSSGEKELVYGYLRMRNVAPKRSILLLDEPELHLNPRLILGLPEFYRQYLGSELDNQLWMVTHSDTFLREAVGRPGFFVFHMLPANASNATSGQAVKISADDEVERAVIALVGDLAAYKPGQKIVIVESTHEADFDASVIRRLFPGTSEKLNLFSGDNKIAVQRLRESLDRTFEQTRVPFNVYAIVDADSDGATSVNDPKVYKWDVYHIENYLLEPHFIIKVLKDAGVDVFNNESEVEQALKQCAKNSFDSLLAHLLRQEINREMLKMIDFGVDPSRSDVADQLSAAICRSSRRVQEYSSDSQLLVRLRSREASIRRDYEVALDDARWKAIYRGRDILTRFVGLYARGWKYEFFRETIIARMRDAEYQPAGMAAVLNSIVSDP